MYAKQRLPDAPGLPDHVVNLYLLHPVESIANRTRNIIRNVLSHPQTAEKQSEDIDAVNVLVSNQTKYSKQMTPAERKSAAVKAKLSRQFVDSSSSSSETEEEASKRKKRKVDFAKEAQRHTKMCEKVLKLWTALTISCSKWTNI